jgi:hypothetical protein
VPPPRLTEGGVTVDTQPPDGPPASDDPPYRLPSPLRHDGVGLPVAPSAPRIPRALRAFNGMPPPAPEPPPVESSQPPPRLRVREPQRTIRDLLLDADPPVAPEESGLIAGLRSAWRRLRRPDAEDDGAGP